MSTRVMRATRDDAFLVAALQLQADLEFGCAHRPNFMNEYADAWLADFDRRPTWLAKSTDGAGVGMVVTAMTQKLPSLCRAATRTLHVSNVFVRPQDRGAGVAERMLRAMLAWGNEHQVERYSLNAVDGARGLYERVGFTASAASYMELRTSD